MSTLRVYKVTPASEFNFSWHQTELNSPQRIQLPSSFCFTFFLRRGYILCFKMKTIISVASGLTTKMTGTKIAGSYLALKIPEPGWGLGPGPASRTWAAPAWWAALPSTPASQLGNAAGCCSLSLLEKAPKPQPCPEHTSRFPEQIERDPHQNSAKKKRKAAKITIHTHYETVLDSPQICFLKTCCLPLIC